MFEYNTHAVRFTVFCLVSVFAGCGGADVREQPAPLAPRPQMEDTDTASPTSLQPPLRLVWKQKLYGPLLAPPAMRDTTAYLMMTNNKLLRINVRTGAHQDIAKFKGIAQAPPVLRNDMLYLSFAGQVNRDLRILLAYDLRRESVRWRRPFENGRSAPALNDSMLFIGAEDGGVYAISAETGEMQWRYMTDRQVLSSPVVSNNVVFVGSNNNHLYALDAVVGERLWSYRTGGSITTGPVVSNHSVYVASYDGSLYCLDRVTGRLRWRFATQGSLYSTPAVQDNRVFLGANDRNVYCIDAETGSLLWRFETNGFIKASPVPIGSIVYIGSSDTRIYALDTMSGASVWQYKTDGSITVTPVIADRMLLVGSEDRYMYAFAETGVVSSDQE